jgi:hypothetical protein
MKTVKLCENDDKTMQMAFISDITISTFLLPSVSATEPHAYAPTIIPIKMMELSHPFV